MSDIAEFYTEFMQEIYARSGAEGDFNEAVLAGIYIGKAIAVRYM